MFTRGFIWPFCNLHLAQLRRDYQLFKDRDSEVIAVGPEGPRQFESYWQSNGIPFIGLPDPESSVLKLYGQEVNLFKLGRLPAQAIIAKWMVFQHWKCFFENRHLWVLLELSREALTEGEWKFLLSFEHLEHFKHVEHSEDMWHFRLQIHQLGSRVYSI